MDERTVFQPSASGPVRPGVRLNGTYGIERLIGEGGMGEVYRGFTIETRDPVAIKMIRPDMSQNPDALALFRREASTLHKLQHEAIVRYYVFSVDPDLRRAYLAMEFVEGVSLAKRLARGPLPVADVMLLKQRIGGALQAAHQLGIVHRDISSDNLILPDGDVRRAKVIDFGIAKSHQAGEGTIIGDSFAGKHKYASPEQLAGQPVTFKSDIYSFGLVLAEALRGAPIDMGGTTFEVVEKRRKVPDLSDMVAQIRPLIHAMLEPNPAARPESMDAVAKWTPSAAPASRAAAPRRAPASTSPKAARGSSNGGLWVGLVVLLAIASVGATLYVFRDDVTAALKPYLEPAPPIVTTLPKPPKLASAVPTTIDTPAPADVTPPLTSAETPTAAPAGPGPRPSDNPPKTGEKPATPVDKEVVMNMIRPQARQPSATLPPAHVGVSYKASLPGFADPGKLPLRLSVEPAPPPGLTFTDLGQGQAEISGAPTEPGTASLRVTATNTKDAVATMDVTLAVEPAAAIASPSPAPARAEATPNPGSSAAAVAPRANLADKQKQFLSRYDGAPCLLARKSPSDPDPFALQIIAADAAALTSFAAAYKKEVTAEAKLSSQTIDALECPTLKLLALTASAGAQAPRLELKSPEVGRGHPLAGTVEGLNGRTLKLVAIGDDGSATPIPATLAPGGASASFSVNLTADPEDVGHTLALLAIASDAPFAALKEADLGKANQLAAKLIGQWAEAGGAADAGFAKLVK